MLSISLAVKNYLCRDCGATVNLRRLAERDRRVWFACGFCPDCANQPRPHHLQEPLFPVDGLTKPAGRRSRTV